MRFGVHRRGVGHALACALPPRDGNHLADLEDNTSFLGGVVRQPVGERSVARV